MRIVTMRVSDDTYEQMKELKGSWNTWDDLMGLLIDAYIYHGH